MFSGFLAAALAVGLALSPVLTVGPVVSAPSMGDILDLFNYKLLKSGTELQAAMGPTAAAAWGPETARVATRSASAYNIAAATSGIAEIVPDAVLLRPQDLPNVVRPSGLKHYVTKFTGLGLNKPLPVAGAFIAMTGFQYRADIAGGVSSWLGIDAQSAVCGDPSASGGFLNFITGQDCSAFQLSAEFAAQANADAVAGYVGSRVCKPGGAVDECVTFLGYGNLWVGSNTLMTMCFKVEGSVNSSPHKFRLQAPSGLIRGSSGSEWTVTLASSTPGTRCLEVWPATTAVWAQAKSGSGGFTEDYILIDYGWAARDGVSYLGATSGAVEFSDGNPLRWWVCDLTGSDGNHYTATSESFREGDSAAVAVACPNLPSGVTVVHMTVTEIGGSEPNIVVDEDALADPLGDGSGTGTVTTAYCEQYLCMLELMEVASGRSCFDLGDACDGWMQSPTRDTDYKCYYGGKVQEAKECYVYAQVFNTSARLAGNPYADPKTGEDTGAQSGLSIDELIMGSEPRPAAFGRDCFGGDWGAANPVNWVLRPIQCGLEWAFVPRAEVVQLYQSASMNAWDDTVFGQVGTVLAPFAAIPIATGCTGWPIDLVNTWPQPWEWHLVLGAACTGPTAVLAGVIRTVSGGLIGLGGLFAISSYLGVPLGFRGFGRGGSRE